MIIELGELIDYTICRIYVTGKEFSVDKSDTRFATDEIISPT